MATGKLLRQLIKSGIEGNVEAFRTASEEVIKEERQKQHHLLANDLERLLYGRPRESNYATARVPVPVDRERNLALLDIREPVRRIEQRRIWRLPWRRPARRLRIPAYSEPTPGS